MRSVLLSPLTTVQLPIRLDKKCVRYRLVMNVQETAIFLPCVYIFVADVVD